MRAALIAAAMSAGASCPAQETVRSITGTVCNAEDGSALGFATVRLRSTDDSLTARVTATDSTGTFRIDSVAGGRYTINVTCTGYIPYTATMSTADTHRTDILLREDPKMLGEVTVTAEYTTTRPTGETVVKVHGNPMAKGKDTQDFLRTIRGLDVTDRSISVNGRENTIIYIDDRKTDYEHLKSIPPSMIDRIEITPYAGAFHGVNATGGVIRIITRRHGGLLGALTARGQADPHGPVDGVVTSSTLYSKGRLSINNSLQAGAGRYHTKSLRRDTQDAGTSETSSNATNRDRMVADYIGMTYSMGKSGKIDLYGGVMIDNPRRQEHSSGDDRLDISADNRYKSYSAGAMMRKSLSRERNSYALTRIEYWGSNSSTGLNYRLNGTEVTGCDGRASASQDSRMNIVKGEQMLSLDMGGGHSLRAGAEISTVKHNTDDSGIGCGTFVPEERSRYSQINNDYGAWAEYGKLWGKTVYLQLAVNYHGTNIRYDNKLDGGGNFSRYQQGVYPSAMFQWLIDSKKGRYLSAGYRHYYSLPDYGYYSPVTRYQNGNLYFTGNINLTQELYDDFEVSFSPSREWSLTYRLNYGDNMVNVMMDQDEGKPGTFYTKPYNTGHCLRQFVTLRLNSRITSFWHTSTSIEYQYRNEGMPGRKVCCSSVSVNTDNNFSLCKNAGLQLSFYAGSKTRALSFDSDSSLSLGAGGYASLMKDRLSVSLTANNLLYKKRRITMRGSGWQVWRRTDDCMTRFKLSATWNFSLGEKIQNQRLNTVNGISAGSPTL